MKIMSDESQSGKEAEIFSKNQQTALHKIETPSAVSLQIQKKKWEETFLFRALVFQILLVSVNVFTIRLDYGSSIQAGMGFLGLIYYGFPFFLLLLLVVAILFYRRKGNPSIITLTVAFMIASSVFYPIYIKDTKHAIEALYYRNVLIKSEFDVKVTDYYFEGKKIGFKVDIITTKNPDNSLQMIYEPSIGVYQNYQIQRRLGKEYRPSLIVFNRDEFINYDGAVPPTFVPIQSVCEDGECSAIFIPSVVKTEDARMQPRDEDTLCSQIISVPIVTKKSVDLRCNFNFDAGSFLVRDKENRLFAAVNAYPDPEKWDEQFSNGAEWFIKIERRLLTKQGELLDYGASDLDQTVFVPLGMFPKEQLFNGANLLSCKSPYLVSGESNSQPETLTFDLPSCVDYLDVTRNKNTEKVEPVTTSKTQGVLFANAKDLGEYRYIAWADNVSLGLYFDTVRLSTSEYGGNESQSIRYMLNGDADSGESVTLLLFSDEHKAQVFLSLLVEREYLIPNGSFEHEFRTADGKGVMWLNKNQLFYVSSNEQDGTFKQQATKYYTGIFPPDFSPKE